MKKEKLSLDKLQVCSFKTTETVRTKGGTRTTDYPALCDSEVRCETIHYTACYGENQ
ncbi:MAG: hypothetical protein WBH03_10775 [Cyclobacteriaceae bacterium]